jgi:predicted Fe-Mo cluster-binding NifX family protein
MKIIITTTSPDLDAEVDPRFGRGWYFLAVDSDTLAWEAHANPALEAAGGAGTQAAQFVAGLGVGAVISGDFGPNAYLALEAAGIAMYLLGTDGSARAVAEAFKNGQLERVGGPTGPAQHSGHRAR